MTGLPNILPSDRAAVLAAIDPDAYAASTVVSGYVDIANWSQLMAIIAVGDMVATSTVDAKIQQATDNSGTGAKDVTGLAITQLTQAGTDDNKQAIINVTQTDLDFNNDFHFVQLSVTIGTAGSDLAALLLGFDPRYNTASDNDASTVDEIVSG